MDTKKLRSLIEEVEREADGEGWERCIYGHTGHGHSIETRMKYLNHKAILAQVKSEINHILDEEDKKVTVPR